MMKTIDEIFSDVTLIGQTPSLIAKAKLPEKIFDEVKAWIDPCRAIKDDEYRELLNHRNVGTDHNSYQTAVPRRLIDNSFFLGYVCHFGNLYINLYGSNVGIKEKYSRRVQMRNYSGHFDGYDCWVNFTYKGDDNPRHNHAGTLSSIIYIKDKDCQPTIFPTIDYVHEPEEGEILLFPSELEHYVDKKETESERISASFNLEYINFNQ
tara:strand:+ start:4288 stop:4911 length:624 start_codon:yes stop_codon:yes gene_type:complete